MRLLILILALIGIVSCLPPNSSSLKGIESTFESEGQNTKGKVKFYLDSYHYKSQYSYDHRGRRLFAQFCRLPCSTYSEGIVLFHDRYEVRPKIHDYIFEPSDRNLLQQFGVNASLKELAVCEQNKKALAAQSDSDHNAIGRILNDTDKLQRMAKACEEVFKDLPSNITLARIIEQTQILTNQMWGGKSQPVSYKFKQARETTKQISKADLRAIIFDTFIAKLHADNELFRSEYRKYIGTIDGT